MVGSRFEKSTPARRNTHPPPSHVDLLSRASPPLQQILATVANSSLHREVDLVCNSQSGGFHPPSWPSSDPRNCRINQRLVDPGSVNPRFLNPRLIHGFFIHGLLNHELFIHAVLIHGGGTSRILPQMWWDTSKDNFRFRGPHPPHENVKTTLTKTLKKHVRTPTNVDKRKRLTKTKVPGA